MSPCGLVDAGVSIDISPGIGAMGFVSPIGRESCDRDACCKDETRSL